MLWYLECPVGLSQNEYVRISVTEMWRNFDGPPHQWFICMHHSTDGIKYTTVFATPVVKHRMEGNMTLTHA